MPNRQPPGAPKKAPPKFILPSSRFYTENNENNLTATNRKVKTVKLKGLVEAARKNPGNVNINYFHKNLNTPVNPKGGKRKTQRKRRHTKRKHTRKH